MCHLLCRAVWRGRRWHLRHLGLASWRVEFRCDGPTLMAGPAVLGIVQGSVSHASLHAVEVLRCVCVGAWVDEPVLPVLPFTVNGRLTVDSSCLVE
jgi:hypothetical protein